MGLFPRLWQLLFGEEPRTARHRGPSHGGDDRVKREYARYLDDLRKNNRARWREIIEREHGLSTDSHDPLDELLKLGDTMKRLKESGLVPGDGAAGDSLDKLIAALPAIMQALPQVAQTMRTAAQQRRGQGRPPPVTVDHQLPGPTADPPEEAILDDPESDPEEPSMLDSLMRRAAASYAQAELARRPNPTDAAAWLLSRTEDGAVAMVALIRDTPDDRLIEVLDEQARAYPEFKGLMSWLAARAAWTVQVAQALRDLQAPGPLPPAKRGRKKAL